MRVARKALEHRVLYRVTIEMAVEQYCKHKMRKGFWDIRTEEKTGGDLRQMARLMPDGPIALVDTDWVMEYLELLIERGLALATQKNKYFALAEFLRYCVRERWLTENPCDFIHREDRPWVGRRAKKQMGRGKPQLRNSEEVKKYLAEAQRNTDVAKRVASQLPLLCGLRSGELRHLQIADLDFQHKKIWIRDDDDDAPGANWEVKTASSRRTVQMPNHLVDDLKALCEGYPSDKRIQPYVFHSSRGCHGNYGRTWLCRAVRETCKAAGVREITPHGLRDTFTSLQRELGRRSAADIAELLGHADDGKTAEQHYIGAAAHQPALRVILGGKDGTDG